MKQLCMFINLKLNVSKQLKFVILNEDAVCIIIEISQHWLFTRVDV